MGCGETILGAWEKVLWEASEHSVNHFLASKSESGGFCGLLDAKRIVSPTSIVMLLR
jgi:hypothetical protein